jgi:anoctamin-10
MAPPTASAESNLDVDYVLIYRFSPDSKSNLLILTAPTEADQIQTDKSKAITGFQNLIRALADVGLETEVRNGEDSTLLIFVKAADEQIFSDVVYKSRYSQSLSRWHQLTGAHHRVRDWLHGARQAQPDKGTEMALTKEPLTAAERFRLVHQMITSESSEGGAGITPKHGEWECVEAIFPLHDVRLNKEWMTEWARKTFLSTQDLDSIRDNLGEKVSWENSMGRIQLLTNLRLRIISLSCNPISTF